MPRVLWHPRFRRYHATSKRTRRNRGRSKGKGQGRLTRDNNTFKNLRVKKREKRNPRCLKGIEVAQGDSIHFNGTKFNAFEAIALFLVCEKEMENLSRSLCFKRTRGSTLLERHHTEPRYCEEGGQFVMSPPFYP